MNRPYPASTEPGRPTFWSVPRARAAHLGGLLLHVGAVPFRSLPKATIGVQITLLSLVTTVPFLILIIVWSIQASQGATHTIAELVWATIAAIGLGAVSHRRLSVPIGQLSATAQRIGQGDFSVRAPFHRADELGELASMMDAMTANIQELTSELRDTRDRLAQTVTEVGRLATSGLEDEELWPVLADIARRLTSADGSALYANDTDGTLRLAATAGRTVWPERGRLAVQLASEAQLGWDINPVSADRRLAVPVFANQTAVAVLEVYREAMPFLPDTERLLSVFARQAGLTLERMQLRRRAAQAFIWEQTSRTQSEFIALASHELRNPVAALTSYAELLRRTDLAIGAEERQYCLERIEHLSGRLADIVRNLLSVSRIRSGQLRVERVPLDVRTLIQGVASDMRHRDSTITLHEVLAEELPEVFADPVCLEEILMNLLGNAYRHSPAGGTVWLMAEAATVDGTLRVRLRVRDEGPGLTREQQRNLFQRFGQAEVRVGGKPGTGLGLGLYICQVYAQQMGGSISVHSEPGHGATFTVDLATARAGHDGDRAGLH